MFISVPFDQTNPVFGGPATVPETTDPSWLMKSPVTPPSPVGPVTQGVVVSHAARALSEIAVRQPKATDASNTARKLSSRRNLKATTTNLHSVRL